MSDIIRKLLKAEAPKTISKEQLFVYVPQDYHTAVADAAASASTSAKGAQLSLQYAIGKKYYGSSTISILEFDDFEKFLSKVHFEEGTYNFNKYGGKWYFGDVGDGHLVTLEEYGIHPSIVLPSSINITVAVGNVSSDDEGYNDNSKYYKDQAAQFADNASDSADDAEDSAKKSEGYAAGTQDGDDVDSDSPYYENNAKYYSDLSSWAADDSEDAAKKSEGYAKGTQNGVPVTSGSPYYENNALYYSEQASDYADDASDSAGAAALSASSASGSASDAEGYASDAETAKTAAQEYAESAYNFATEASQHKSAASESASAAADSADEAAEYLDEMGTLYTAKQDAKPDNTHPLIDNGKVSMTYIPDAILGQVEYQGTWNASNGTPAKTFPTTVKEGYYWICKTSGGAISKTPDGQTSEFSFEVGDWAIINAVSGSVITWDKVDNTDAVTMVNGHNGAVNTYVGEATVGSTYNAGDTVLYNSNLYLVTTQFTFNGSNLLSNVKRYGLSDSEVEAIRDNISAETLSDKFDSDGFVSFELNSDESKIKGTLNTASAENGMVPTYDGTGVTWSFPKAIVWDDIESMVSALDLEDTTRESHYVVGQPFRFRTVGVPDIWITSVANTHNYYSYQSDDDFVQDLRDAEENGLQVGWYVFFPGEGDYATKEEFEDYKTEVQYNFDSLDEHKFADSASAGQVLTADGEGGASYQNPMTYVEVGTAGQTTPSADLAIGGIFFERK